MNERLYRLQTAVIVEKARHRPKTQLKRHKRRISQHPNQAPGSMDVKGQPALMAIPNRDSINTDTTLQRDKTDKIRRGGR